MDIEVGRTYVRNKNCFNPGIRDTVLVVQHGYVVFEYMYEGNMKIGTGGYDNFKANRTLAPREGWVCLYQYKGSPKRIETNTTVFDSKEQADNDANKNPPSWNYLGAFKVEY